MSHSASFTSPRRIGWIIAAGAGLAASAAAFALETSTLREALFASCALIGGAALARNRPATTAATTEAPTAVAPQDEHLFDLIRKAGHAAGVRVWALDVARNELKVPPECLARYSDEAQRALSTPAEFMRLTVHPEDLPAYRASIGKALADQSEFVTHYRAMHRDGLAHPVQLHGKIVRDGEGRPVRLFGVIVDLSPQVASALQAEAQSSELRHMLDRLNLATEAAGIAIWDWDIAAHTIETDAHMARVLGVENGTRIDANAFLRRFIHPDDLQCASDALNGALETGHRLTHTHRILKHDGSIAHSQLQARVFRDESGRAVRLLAVSIDTTSLIEAAQALEQTTQEQSLLLERYNLATEVAGIGVWDWNLETNEMSAGSAVATEQSLEDVPQAFTPDVFLTHILHPGDRENFQRHMTEALNSHDRLELRYRARRKGEIRHMHLHGRIFRNAEGRAVRLLGVNWNVTAEVHAARKIEQQAAERQALLEAHQLSVDAGNIGVWDWDITTNIVHPTSNTARALLAEIDRTTLTGEEFVTQVVHEDDRAEYLRVMGEGLTSHERISTSYRCSIGGKLRHLQYRGHVFRSQSGRPLRLLGVTIDVTAQVEANLEIAKKAAAEHVLLERLNLATEVSGIGVWDWDIPADRMMIDARIRHFYGSDSCGEHGNAFEVTRQLVHADDLARFDESRAAALDRGDAWQLRYRVINLAGQVRHVQAAARIFRDEAGKAIRMLGVSTDVTDQVEHAQKLEQQALAERTLRDRFNLATRTAGIGVWDMDLQTRKIQSEENLQRLLGVHREFDEAALIQAIHPEDRAPVYGAIERALVNTRDDIMSVRHRIVPVDGAPMRHIQTHIRAFRTPDGRPTRILGVTWDVTAEVEHAEELRQRAISERAVLNRFNMATEVAAIMTWEYDMARRGFVWDHNRLHVLGLDNVPIEELEPAVMGIVHPEDAAAFYEKPREAVLSNSDRFSFRFRFKGATGEWHHLQTHGRILRDESGRAIRTLGVTWDVTREVQSQCLMQEQADRERILRGRLRVATKAAGMEAWEFDIASSRIVWTENRMSAYQLDHVPLDRYWEELTKLMDPQDHIEYFNTARAAIANGQETFSCRFRVNRKDGTVRHMQTYAHIFAGADKSALRLVGATTDVTNEVQTTALLQRQAEEERSLRDRLSVATDAAGIEAWEFDLRANTFVWVTNRLPALGLSDAPLEAYADRFFSIVDPEDLKRHLAAIDTAVRDGSKTCFSSFRVTRDGKTHWFNVFITVIRDGTGRPLRLVGATSDVTRQVETTELLRRQAEQERALLDRLNVATRSAGIALWEMDLLEQKFLWRENWGNSNKTEGEAPISIIAARTHPEDRDSLAAAIRDANDRGDDSIRYRLRMFAGEGRMVHVQSYARLIYNDAGIPVRALGVSWDVSKEIEATELIQQQAEMQRKLLERLSIATQAAGIASWELDFTLNKIVWQENFQSDFLLAAQARGQDLLQAVIEHQHPDDRQVFTNAVLDAVRNRTDVMKYRYRIADANGHYTHRQNYARLFTDQDGKVTRALGVTWDITKEVEATEAMERQAQQLREVERRLERASLSSLEGHFEWDLITGKAWYSSSFHELLGFAPGELPDRAIESIQQLQRREDREWQKQRFEAHIQRGEPYDLEAQLRMGSGEHRWFRLRGMAELDANGTPIKMAGSMQDIHQQKLAEDALHQAQQRFSRAIHGTQDGLWELEADGSAWIAPRLAELLGHDPSDLPSNTNFIREFLHPDDIDAVASATQAHFQQGAPYDVEIRLRTHSGGYRWYRARATAERDRDGRPVRLSGSLQDVTDARVAREELLQAMSTAESANRAKSSFLANVSHEIRTPMNGIIGMTGLLLETQLDRTQRDYAETIRSSADSLLTVINDILDFSKIEAGKLEIERLELDLRGNVEDVGTMMAFQAAAKNLELVVHVHPDVPERVLGDPQRIRQCLINLVGNAIKFTRHGEIVIEVQTVGSLDGAALVQFEVRDTGIGIPAETLPTLFQPFVQADASTTRHFGGTGLGLSIVRRLVDMMQGGTGVSSEMGKGSRFWFRLPLTPAANLPAQAPLDMSRVGRRVLVVDDNETNRRVLAGQLAHSGYDVSMASGAAEALTVLRQAVADMHPIEVVLCDYQMPDIDGAMLGERINGDPHLSRARVVVLTSLDRHGDVRRFASLGFAGYLTKPVRARELFECLDRVLARESREWHMQSQPLITRNAIAEHEQAKRFSGRVLLVEDNAVNQKVATRFLERLGCEVTIANNGEEGVHAYEGGGFDIVLMDLQMPVMDGLTATQHIRSLEAGKSHIPIVALTANAMAGQLERCLSAGMDAFLSKPLEVARLRETLERFGLGVKSEVSASSAVSESGPVPLDLGRWNELTGDDPEFAHEIASTFTASGEQVLAEVSNALAAVDRGALARAAHKIKGASANIHATVLRDIAYALESEAAAASTSRLNNLCEKLKREFRRADEFLRQNLPPLTSNAAGQ